MIFLVWLLGLCFGSFANVCIYRGIKNELIWGRSYCPKCQRHLQFFDLIPLISWIFFRSKCRYCKSEISWQYPLIELMCATAWTVIYTYTAYQLSFVWILYSLIALIFIITAYGEGDILVCVLIGGLVG